MKIRLALESPDRRWRVEVFQRGRSVCYRLLEHDEVVRPWLTIGQIEDHFAAEGISMDHLVDVTHRFSVPPTLV